jgi:hypothetical protein
MLLALPVERKIIVTFIAAVLAMHQWHDGLRSLYWRTNRVAIFFERRSNVDDILANDSGCMRFSTRYSHESRHAPAYATHDGLAAQLTAEEVRRWRR